MIVSFKHKGLELFFKNVNIAGIQAQHATRLRLILAHLNVSSTAEDMNLPGLALHPLSGDRKGIWAVKVNGNWRVTFRMNGEDAEIVNYEDYH